LTEDLKLCYNIHMVGAILKIIAGVMGLPKLLSAWWMRRKVARLQMSHAKTQVKLKETQAKAKYDLARQEAKYESKLKDIDDILDDLNDD